MLEVVILKSGGFRNDYVGIYLDGKIWWQNTDYTEEYNEKLLELLQMPGEKHVVVEDVHEDVAEWMGLHKEFSDTLAEWRNVCKVVLTGHA